jgi:hypothetical protein
MQKNTPSKEIVERGTRVGPKYGNESVGAFGAIEHVDPTIWQYGI